MRYVIGTLGCVALLLVPTGCGLLDTTRPDTIDPGALDNPTGATALYNGALADFILARDGDGDVATARFTEGHAIITGWLSDEFTLSSTPEGEQEVDQRTVAFETNTTVSGFYTQLHKARNEAEKGVVHLQRFSTDTTDDPRIAELWALAGYTYLYFAEDFCDGVAYSTTNGSTVVSDTSRSRLETWALAQQRFDSALASPSLSPEIEYLARIGQARALINLDPNNRAAAAALVSGVPTSFSYVTEHSIAPATTRNAVFTWSQGKIISVENLAGGVGLPYHDDTVRIKVDSILVGGEVEPGLDLQTPQFYQGRFPDATSSIPVASGIEARLIEAENELANAAYGAMNSILNTLRLGTTLSPLPVPATQAEAEDQLFSERAYWLFGTGQRLEDMQRLVRQYGRNVDTVFPNGPYSKSGSYGTQVRLPIPFEANNNPRFNRNMCNPDVP